MVDMSGLPAFVVAVALICLAPGPDNTYISAVAARHGPRAGLTSAVGMALGMSVHVTATAVGLAVVLSAHDWAIVAINLAGGAYLAHLAIETYRELRRSGESGEHPTPPPHALIRRAVFTNLTNPKVILFFASFLPQFARPENGSLTAQLLILGLIFLIVGLVCDGAIGLSVGWLGRGLAASTSAAAVLTVLAGTTYVVLSALLIHDGMSSLLAGSG